MRRAWPRWGIVGAAALAAVAATPARAVVSHFCDGRSGLSAADQDRLFRLAAVVKGVLDATPHGVALIARSGLDLDRFGIRYSHAGIVLKDAESGAWSVRQLYYACDDARARLFDEGLAGFVLGTHDPASSQVSLVLLPAADAVPLRDRTADKARALELLGADYSANAYAFGTRYQNCNQWVVEMLASAWADEAREPLTRTRAQAWLVANGYRPSPVDVGSHALMFAAPFVPYIHLSDHPADDRFALRLHISMPASIEAFVRHRAPAAERVEVCSDRTRVVVHRGWEPMAPGCQPGPDDEVIPLDS